MKMQNIEDVKNAAHKILAKFQTGKITKDELYAEGCALTIQFNELMDSAASDPTYYLAKDTASLLHVIKHFATC
ncbi:TPA: hypothetical protein HJM91_004708 [Escherichia coli]|nr:hypothetical protein [Escherichia coli]HBW5292698.1 hypothetical protein [Klebsiella pneumoniae]